MIEANPGEAVLDCGSVALSGVDAGETAEVAAAVDRLDCEGDVVRAVRVPGADGHVYVLVANFGDEPIAARVTIDAEGASDVVSKEALGVSAGVATVALEAGAARLLRVG